MSLPQHRARSGQGIVTERGKKSLLTTSNPFEQKFRYCRAVKRGPCIWVSGTTAVESEQSDSQTGAPSQSSYPEGAEKQARLAMKRCVDAVTDLGGTLEDVVRVRMFVANAEDCGVVGEVYKEVFGMPDPDQKTKHYSNDVVAAAATMIVVPGGFVDENMLVEIEVDAYKV